MEVKNICVNFIMRTYEKQDPANESLMGGEIGSSEMKSDDVSISPMSTKRLFGDLMEHSLKKGLSEVRKDENS